MNRDHDLSCPLRLLLLMMLSSSPSLACLVLILHSSSAFAARFKVDVGLNSTGQSALRFNPEFVLASPGDCE